MKSTAPAIEPNVFIVMITLCVAMLFAIAAGAHEIGKTQVQASLRDGAYEIDVVVDPDALLPTLEAYGQRRSRATCRATSATGASRRSRACSSSAPRCRSTAARLRPPSNTSRRRRSTTTRRRRRKSGSVAPIPAGASAFTFTYGLALGTYALNARIGDGPVQTQWVVGGAPSAPVSLSAPLPAPTRAEIGWQYFALGFTHILPHGFDHVLFVVGIFLLTSKWQSIVAQVSTFTVAHSITLALTMYGIVSLPAKVVEPMIALSIAYVAIENLMVSELKPWRLALVFSFGLLHGMGFAGVLRDLGLPRPAFLTALVTFNVGVEAGQLTVIAFAFAACAYWQQRDRATYRRFIVVPASFAIALVGVFWTVQRALA